MKHGSAGGREYGREGVREYGREGVREYGREGVRAYGREYGREYWSTGKILNEQNVLYILSNHKIYAPSASCPYLEMAVYSSDNISNCRSTPSCSIVSFPNSKIDISCKSFASRCSRVVIKWIRLSREEFTCGNLGSEL